MTIVSLMLSRTLVQELFIHDFMYSLASEYEVHVWLTLSIIWFRIAVPLLKASWNNLHATSIDEYSVLIRF